MKSFQTFKNKITTISIIDHWEAPHYPKRDSHEVDNRAKIKKIAGDLIIELSTLSDVKNYNFVVKSLNRIKNDLQSIIDGFRNHTERDHFANYHHLFGNVYSMKEIILENIPTNLEKDYMYFQVNSFLEEVNFKLQLVNHVIENIEKHSDSAIEKMGKIDTKTEEPAKSLGEEVEKDDRSELNKKKEDIKERIVNVDTKGWRYSFKNEKDFEEFTQYLADYFTGNLDKNKISQMQPGKIKLQHHCKTRLAQALKEIQQQFGKGKLKQDEDFFKIVKTLDHYSEESDLYHTISR